LFTLQVYNGNNSGPANNFDLTAKADPGANFAIRNGHLIFTEPYNIGYLLAQSAHMTDARLVSPTFSALNADGFRIAGFSQTAGLGGVPTLVDRFLSAPPMVPQYEEVQFQGSTGTAEQQWGAMVLLTPGWNANVPSGPQMMMEATVTSFTPTVNVWSTPQALNFNSSPRGGVYAVIGASVQQTADTFAFQIVFPRTKLYNGRKLNPGWIAQNAVGSFEDVITQMNRFHLGVWGYFHTFEPPSVAVFPSTSAAMTPIVRLWTVYLGGDINLLNSALNTQN